MSNHNAPDRDRVPLTDFGAEVAMFLGILHDRGLVNETALLDVCRQLVQHKPLTIDHLVAIFGVGPIYTLIMTSTSWEQADRRRLQLQLEDIQELLSASPESNDGVRATLQLITLLKDELCLRPRWPTPLMHQPAVAEQLVREAYDLLKNPESELDLRSWLREAEHFMPALKGERPT